MDVYSHVLPGIQQGASDKLEIILFEKTGTNLLVRIPHYSSNPLDTDKSYTKKPGKKCRAFNSYLEFYDEDCLCVALPNSTKELFCGIGEGSSNNVAEQNYSEVVCKPL
jgi:hypothetical protein